MRFRYGLARIRAWLQRWSTAPLVDPREPVAAGARLSELCGYAAGRRVVVVTDRGVEIPIGRADGWDVVTFTRLLAQIDRLPETPDRDGAVA